MLKASSIVLCGGTNVPLSPEMSRSRDSAGASTPVTFTLWALGSYLAAGDRSAVVDDDGEMLPLDKYLVQALENGTNMNHPGYWAFGDSRSAKKIPEQAAAVAFAAWAARSLLFRRLSNQSIMQLEQWLESAGRIKVRKKSYLSLAVALNHAARRGMGLRHDEAVIESALEAVERCYLEEGWFADGGSGSRQFDDSVSWGYLTLLSALIYVEGGKRSARYETWEPRIRTTLRDFPYLYDPSGGTPEYGDTGAGSLARLAGPLAGHLIGAWPGKPGVLKRMVRLHLNRLLSRGGIDSVEGRLSPPGGERNDGAHYRAMQSIGFLLLHRGDDPFWKAREEQLPAERGDFVRYIASPGWMVHGAKQDGHVQLINGGSANGNRRLLPGILPRYGKFSYSSCMGLVEGAGDRSADLYLRQHPFGEQRQKELEPPGQNTLLPAHWGPYSLYLRAASRGIDAGPPRQPEDRDGDYSAAHGGSDPGPPYTQAVSGGRSRPHPRRRLRPRNRRGNGSEDLGHREPCPGGERARVLSGPYSGRLHLRGHIPGLRRTDGGAYPEQPVPAAAGRDASAARGDTLPGPLSACRNQRESGRQRGFSLPFRARATASASSPGKRVSLSTISSHRSRRPLS